MFKVKIISVNFCTCTFWWTFSHVSPYFTFTKCYHFVFFPLWGKKKHEKSIRISPQLFIILPNALASKEQSIQVFFKTILSILLHPFGYPFLICGASKIGQIYTSEVKNDDNSKFFLKTPIQDFFCRVYMAYARSRHFFLALKKTQKKHSHFFGPNLA